MFFKAIQNLRKMSSILSFTGKIPIKKSELNLNLTLLGGQSFRWEKANETDKLPEWRGVAFDAYWVLSQDADAVTYNVFPAPSDKKNSRIMDDKYYNDLIKRYFRIDFNLPEHVEHWKVAHEHFAHIAADMKAVRVLNQEPLENIISFICSQNNNIKRISSMIQWLCASYGKRIGNFNGRQEYTFPTLDALVYHQNKLDENLRSAKFGYRAKFISQTVAKISSEGGAGWFDELRKLPYAEARLALVSLPGIGFKVADCICLMSLNHLEAVPIDTHIYKIAQSAYMPNLAGVKSVTPKIYEEVSAHFRNVYGAYAGWAQAILFCSGLQLFQPKTMQAATNTDIKKKRRK